MDIFKDLNDLWHNYDSFNDLFKDMRNFNNFLNSSIDRDWVLLESINNFELVLNIVLFVDNLDKLRYLDDFFLDYLDLFAFPLFWVYLDNLFDFNWNLFNYLFSVSDFDYFVNVFFDNFVHFNQLRNDGLKLNNLMLFD